VGVVLLAPGRFDEDDVIHDACEPAKVVVMVMVMVVVVVMRITIIIMKMIMMMMIMMMMELTCYTIPVRLLQ
jgi:hypothetical protein